jgi:hypothetical protein
MASETYEYLKNLANGQELNRWSQPDYLIYDIHHKRGSNTIKVVITFDKDDDFLEVLVTTMIMIGIFTIIRKNGVMGISYQILTNQI